MAESDQPDPERQRLDEDRQRKKNWKRWGPYLAERQWGTVREDYSADGDCWRYFPHDHARSRVYRWGEDGLMGLTDRECRLCFAPALWNGRDAILKERLFGLSNSEGNHGEDVKEYYFYLDATPTNSYLKALYKYPQAEFPYDLLLQENARRGKQEPEFELLDTGIFNDNAYFDVGVEYAKSSPDNILIRLTIANRGATPAELDLLATLWFRNTWCFGSPYEPWKKPNLFAAGANEILAEHETLGRFHLLAAPGPGGSAPALLFTDNETNAARLFGSPNPSPFLKDGLHEFVVRGQTAAVNPARTGTKAATHYHLSLAPGETVTLKLRLFSEEERSDDPLGAEFDATFDQRQAEAEQYYRSLIPPSLPQAARDTMRQAYANLLWTRQFYYYVVPEWLDGDPKQPAPPPQRRDGRNHTWAHLFNRNVLSMPDSWEFPWYAAWDLGFQMVAFARLDPEFAKEQLVLLLREWFMHPNGELPAYEFNLSDVNPPVHAWACWRVYKISAGRGQRDFTFLERAFHKLLMVFTWWVNRKDVHGRQIFTGGFLGMDNIGVFDRSLLSRVGQYFEQADATAWMAFFCVTMLAISLELAKTDPSYEDMASKFFNHFVGITDAINHLGGTGLWDDQDGLYYDQVRIDGNPVRLRARSMVSLLPLIAVEVLDDLEIGRLPGFMQRLNWFLENRKDLARDISYMQCCHGGNPRRLRLLAIPSRERLERVLAYMLDEKEFLSPYGIRSLSKFHQDHPFTLQAGGSEHCIDYEPGDATSDMFGGNSNWRGPVWFPLNYIIVESLERYHHFYRETFQVECPTGSGVKMNLSQVAAELTRRLCNLFLPDAAGHCPWQGRMQEFWTNPHWKGLAHFNEYFHGETGEGLGASHQTGWTALIVRLLEDLAP